MKELEETSFEKLVEKKPNLRELEIYENWTQNSDEEEVVQSLLTQLFQSCTESLKELHIHECRLQTVQLSNAPLKNLSFLSLIITDERSLDNVWHSLASIKGRTVMPRLKEVLIFVELRREEILHRQWPSLYLGRHPVRRRFSSVRKLGIHFKNSIVNLFAVSAIFPNISSLTSVVLPI